MTVLLVQCSTQVLRQLDEDKSHREQDMEKLKAEVYSQQALLQVLVGKEA